MMPNQDPLTHLFNRARLHDQPDIPAPPALSAVVLTNLRSLQTPPQNLQQTLACGIALAASITLFLLLSPDVFPPFSPLTEPESIAQLFIDLSDL